MKPVILYPPTIDWSYLHQRPQQLLKALSRLGYTCIFCNPDIHHTQAQPIVYLHDTLILANKMSWENTLTWAKSTYPTSPLIGYFTYPPHYKLLKQSNLDLLWFDAVDEPVAEFSSWLSTYAEAVGSGQLVTASAHSLQKRSQCYAKGNVSLLPNGCDYEHFKKAQIKQEAAQQLWRSNKPIIGYIGAIAPWLDWKLINTMAHFWQQYDFLFIGPLLLSQGMALTSGNMHYLGHKDYALLPQYLSIFDYCLLPFKLTPMTQGVNPIKFWEYLASGIPILSTPLPEIPAEYVCHIQEEWFPAFIPSHSRKEKAERIAFAQKNSWQERAHSVHPLLHELLAHG